MDVVFSVDHADVSKAAISIVEHDLVGGRPDMLVSLKVTHVYRSISAIAVFIRILLALEYPALGSKKYSIGLFLGHSLVVEVIELDLAAIEEGLYL